MNFNTHKWLVITLFLYCIQALADSSIQYLPICDPLFETCNTSITSSKPKASKTYIKKTKKNHRQKNSPKHILGKKVALVIGNQSYQRTGILKNPINDANAISQKLKQLGFNVTLLKNANQKSFKSALYRFGREASKAKLALIFYAGHALQINGENYLLPVDSPNMRQANDIYQLINVNNDIMNQVSSAQTGVLILDACRTNPLLKNIPRVIKGRSITVGRGLARIKNRIGDTLVAYATSPGEIALDGKTNHSPFTQALLENMNKVIDIRILFGMIRDSVAKKTNNQQSPEIISSLGGNTVFLSR